MIFKKIFVMTISLGFVNIIADSIDDYIQSQIDNGFPGVATLFEKLNNVQDELAATKESFNQQRGYFADYYVHFDEVKAKRESTFACIRQSFVDYVQALADCVMKKEHAVEAITLDLKNVAFQIIDLANCTDAQIDYLNNDIAIVQSNIIKIQQDYSTLSQMSLDEVNAAIAKMTAIQAEYEEMVIARTSFLDCLNSLLGEINTSENSEAQQTYALQSEYCPPVQTVEQSAEVQSVAQSVEEQSSEQTQDQTLSDEMSKECVKLQVALNATSKNAVKQAYNVLINLCASANSAHNKKL